MFSPEGKKAFKPSKKEVAKAEGMMSPQEEYGSKYREAILMEWENMRKEGYLSMSHRPLTEEEKQKYKSEFQRSPVNVMSGEVNGKRIEVCAVTASETARSEEGRNFEYFGTVVLPGGAKYQLTPERAERLWNRYKGIAIATSTLEGSNVRAAKALDESSIEDLF